MRQLREQYETTKAEAERFKSEAERWSKLGDYEQVSQLHGTFSQRLTQAVEAGRTLGFNEQQIREAMMEDPKGTLAYLQQEAAKPATLSQQEIDRRIREGIDSNIKPIREQFEAQANDKANGLYEAERDRLFKSEFTDGLPDENREELFEILDGLFAQDQAALSRLKFQGQTSDIKRHLEAAKTVFLKRHNAYIGHERGKGQPKDGKFRRNEDVQAGTKFSDRKLSPNFGGGTVKDMLNF